MPARLRQTDQAVALLYHARAATPFCSADGEPCASVPMSMDARQVLPLRSAAFRDWLTSNFYGEYELAPSAPAFRAALRTLEARARYGEFPAQKVDRRVSFDGDRFTPSKIILDLANSDGEIVEITSKGWQITNNLRHCFRQSPATLPLPHPPQSPAPSPEPLAKLAKLFRLSDGDRARTLAWLMNALRPVSPYPVLVVQGPAASGKSIFARALRFLIDPSSAPVQRLPDRNRELLDLAFENWVLVFDHVRRVASRIAEALCAISSGEALDIAQPDHRDPLVFQVARPTVLISSMDEPAPPPPRTISNRTLTVELKPIARLLPEAAVWSEFEELRPALLASLADAAATALRRIRDVDLGNAGRFPDCAAWAVAAAPALGLSEPEIVAALSDPQALWMGSDPVRDAVHVLLRSTPVWTGDAAGLLNQLSAIAPTATLPCTAESCLKALSRIAGISVAKNKGAKGGQTLTVTKTANISQHAAGHDAPAMLTR